MISRFYVNDIVLLLFLRLVFCSVSASSFYSTRLRWWLISDTIRNRQSDKCDINSRLLLLRGGSEEDNGPSAKSGLWNSINNVFQMNLNAKDELGNDDTDRIIHLNKNQLFSSLGGGETLLQLDDEEQAYDATYSDMVVSDEITSLEPKISDYNEIGNGNKIYSKHEFESDQCHDDILHANVPEDEDKKMMETSMQNRSLDPFQSPLDNKQSIKESIDEIVREEWDMVPDTEVEDEGNAFEGVAGTSTEKSKYYTNAHKQAEKETPKTNLSDVEESTSYDNTIEQSEGGKKDLNEATSDVISDFPPEKLSADSGSNAFVSSGLVSFLFKASFQYLFLP